MQAGVLDEVIGERHVNGSQTFKEVARTEGETEPKTFGARFGKKSAASEALWVDRVIQVEVADVADVLDVTEKQRDNAAAEIEQIDRWLGGGAIAKETGERKIARESFAGEAADDDLFVRGGHEFERPGRSKLGLANCRMPR